MMMMLCVNELTVHRLGLGVGDIALTTEQLFKS